MGWLALLIAVLLMLAAGGFWLSGVARSKNPGARVPFVAGVICGVMVGTAMAAKRRGINAAGASALKSLIGPAPDIQEYGKYCLSTASRISRAITRGVAERLASR